MKELWLCKQGDGYLAKIGTTILYQGALHQEKGKESLTLYNAFHDPIYTFSYQKKGFRLFRGKPDAQITVLEGVTQGVITKKREYYDWEMSEVTYTFLCLKCGDHVDVILRDQEESLGYVKDGKGWVLHPCYSAQLCAIWMLAQAYKDLEEMEEARFMRAMEAVIEDEIRSDKTLLD